MPSGYQNTRRAQRSIDKRVAQGVKERYNHHDATGQWAPFASAKRKDKIGSVRPAFETAHRREGLANVEFHELRHTLLADMRRSGVDNFHTIPFPDIEQ